MKVCRFGEGRLGIVEGSVVRDVTAALGEIPSCRYPFPKQDLLITYLPLVMTHARRLLGNAPSLPLHSVQFLSPLANPGKLVAAPVNYEKHLTEVRADKAVHNNTPGHTITIHSAGLFLKATSSLVGPGEGITLEARSPYRSRSGARSHHRQDGCECVS